MQTSDAYNNFWLYVFVNLIVWSGLMVVGALVWGPLAVVCLPGYLVSGLVLMRRQSRVKCPACDMPVYKMGNGGFLVPRRPFVSPEACTRCRATL